MYFRVNWINLRRSRFLIVVGHLYAIFGFPLFLVFLQKWSLDNSVSRPGLVSFEWGICSLLLFSSLLSSAKWPAVYCEGTTISPHLAQSVFQYIKVKPLPRLLSTCTVTDNGIVQSLRTHAYHSFSQIHWGHDQQNIDILSTDIPTLFGERMA